VYITFYVPLFAKNVGMSLVWLDAQ